MPGEYLETKKNTKLGNLRKEFQILIISNQNITTKENHNNTRYNGTHSIKSTQH